MLQPRTIELQRAKQGAKRTAATGLERERRPAVRTGRTRVEKGGDLLLEELPLEGAEELFGLGQGQPEMLDALIVPHSTELRGRRGGADVEGCSALDFPFIHDTWPLIYRKISSAISMG